MSLTYIEVIAPCFGLRPTQVYPISEESAPFLSALWIVLVTVLYWTCFRECKNEAYDAAIKKRKDNKIKALTNLVFQEDTRLANKPTAGKENKKKTAMDIECEFDEPPTAQYIFDVIFEEVEEEETTTVLGISPSDSYYLRAVTLFKRRVQTELDEATTKTLAAQKLSSLSFDVSKEQQIIMDHQDGEKLSEVLDFTRLKAVKYFRKHLTVPSVSEKTDGVTLALGHFDGEYLNDLGKELRVVDKQSVKDGEKVLSNVRAAKRKSISFIFDILKPVLPTYGVALLFMIMARAFEAPLWAKSLPSYKNSVATINENAQEGEFGYGPTVLRLAEGHVLFFIVGFFFSRPVEMLASSLADKAARDFSSPLRRAVMVAIMKQDTEYFDFNSCAKLQERLNQDTDELVENLLWVPRQILEHFFRVVQRMTTLYFVAPKMLWACMCLNVPLFAIIMIATTKPLRRLWGKRDRSSRNTGAETAEILQNIKTVRQFSMEVEEKEKYALGNLNRNLFENRIRVVESFTHQLHHVVHMMGQVYVIYVALNLVVLGEAKVEDAVVASTVGMWLQHDFKHLLEQFPKLFKIMRPVRRVASLLASTPRIEQDPNVKENTKLAPKSFTGRIEFKDVSFSYPTERQKQVLGGLSFTAESGQKVAFVGKAGCGKSTAMDLLQRFYNRSGGSITIDGRLIEEYDINHLRRHCGVVSQTNVMFSRSIYENIVYGMADPPGPESQRFLEVCDKAEVWEFINKFANKQYTQLGEKGVKLSGGQKQRIAIARVIIREPTFLFLDEATSALDAINEKAVQSALDDMLKKFKGVAIVVAHRLTTICNCDKIIVMGDDGTKVEEGTHEELLQVPKQVDEDGKAVVGKGLYHTLWDTQQVENGSTERASSSSNPGHKELQVIGSIRELQKNIEEKDVENERLKRELLWMHTNPPPSLPNFTRSKSLPSRRGSQSSDDGMPIANIMCATN